MWAALLIVYIVSRYALLPVWHAFLPFHSFLPSAILKLLLYPTCFTYSKRIVQLILFLWTGTPCYLSDCLSTRLFCRLLIWVAFSYFHICWAINPLFVGHTLLYVLLLVVMVTCMFVLSGVLPFSNYQSFISLTAMLCWLSCYLSLKYPETLYSYVSFCFFRICLTNSLLALGSIIRLISWEVITCYCSLLPVLLGVYRPLRLSLLWRCRRRGARGVPEALISRVI